MRGLFTRISVSYSELGSPATLFERQQIQSDSADFEKTQRRGMAERSCKNIVRDSLLGFEAWIR